MQAASKLFFILFMTISLAKAGNESPLGSNRRMPDIFDMLSRGIKNKINNEIPKPSQNQQNHDSTLRVLKADMRNVETNRNMIASGAKNVNKNSKLAKISSGSKSRERVGQKIAIDPSMKNSPAAEKMKNKEGQKPIKLKNPKANKQRAHLLNMNYGINRVHVGSKGVVYNNKNIVEENNEPKHDDFTDGTEEFEIVWELGPIKKFLLDNQSKEEFNFLYDVIKRANTWLKKYIRIQKRVEKSITPENGHICGYKTPKDFKYKGHMVIVVRDDEDEESQEDRNENNLDDISNRVIASGAQCMLDKLAGVDKGVLNINYDLFFVNLSPYTKAMRVVTVIHEVLHAIAFHYDDKQELFAGKHNEVDRKHKNLQLIKETKAPIFEEGHWIESYILNDFMVPQERSDTIFSIFSLELMEHLSNDIVGNRKMLPNNFLWDHIKDHKDFFKYKCKDDEEPKYPFFCSKNEVNRPRCSKDYKHKTTCRANPDEYTNCRLRVASPQGNCMMQEGDRALPYHYYGPDSRCFEQKNQKDEHIGAVCMKYLYKEENGQSVLYVSDGNSEQACKEDGEKIKFSRRDENGKSRQITVECPNLLNFQHIVELTSCPNDCHNNGICINKKCMCMANYDEATDCRTEKSVQNISFKYEFNLPINY